MFLLKSDIYLLASLAKSFWRCEYNISIMTEEY